MSALSLQSNINGANTTTKAQKLVSKTETKIVTTNLEFELQDGPSNIPGQALVIKLPDEGIR